MWIRLQNKEVLVYANNFYIMKTRGEEKYEISYFDGDSFVKLGFYKSKERAIEVLDEIQSCVNNVNIYQMPEEWLWDGVMKYFVKIEN